MSSTYQGPEKHYIGDLREIVVQQQQPTQENTRSLGEVSRPSRQEITTTVCCGASLVLLVCVAAFAGSAGLIMVVLGSLCLDRKGTPREPEYCATLSEQSMIALVVVGAFLLCCCGLQAKTSSSSRRR